MIHDGYFTAQEEPLILERIEALRPDILLVAMGVPRQEFWIAKNITPRAITAEEIMGRLLKAMVDEGTALLAEGIAARPGDIDLVMINGYGFPAHKGGPMFTAQQGKDLKS